MNNKIIGIAGPAQVGKDTAADYMITQMPWYTKTSFGDPLKQMLRVGLGLTESQLYGNQKEVVDKRYGCTPRHMMQTLGTEWGRSEINKNIWVNAVKDHIMSCDSDFIVPDVRFESEAKMVRENGILIHIKGESTIGSDHISESGVYFKEGDLQITNDGTLDQYKSRLVSLMNTYLI